jgi:hypothetical protein
VVGGHAPAALRRAVRHGNGWYGWELDVPATTAALADLRAAAQRHERPAELGDLEITITPPGLPDRATVRRYEEAGVHRLVVQPATMDAKHMTELISTVGDTLIR